MRLGYSVFLGILVCLWSSSLPADEPPIVAVFDIEDRGSGVKPEVIKNLSDFLATVLAECGYQIVPRDQIRERLKEQKKESYRECYDHSCQIELGRELAAQNVLATKVLKFGDVCKLSANLFDLKKAATVKAASLEAACEEKNLADAVQKLGAKLCLPLQVEKKIPGNTVREEVARIKAEDEAKKEAEAKREEAERRRRRAGLYPLLTMENFTLATALDFVGSVYFGEMDWPEDIGLNSRHDSYVAGSFLLGFEYAFSSFSAGFSMSGGFAEPNNIQYDFKSTNAVVGCPALSFKYRYCGEGEWKLCAGGSMVLGADLEALVNNGYTNTPPGVYYDLNDLWEDNAHAGGLRALQNPVYHLRQRLALRPLGIFTASRENLFVQTELGFLLSVPVYNSDKWEELMGSSTGKWLLYALGLGYRATDWLVPIAEFRGLHMLNADNLSALMWLNLGVRFIVASHLLMLRLSVPLTDKAAMGSDIQFAIGITQEF